MEEEVVVIKKYTVHDNQVQLLIDASDAELKGMTDLHRIYIEDVNGVNLKDRVKAVQFISCDLAPEDLTALTISTQQTDYLPFFFSKTKEGWPLSDTRYHIKGVRLEWLADPPNKIQFRLEGIARPDVWEHPPLVFDRVYPFSRTHCGTTDVKLWKRNQHISELACRIRDVSTGELVSVDKTSRPILCTSYDDAPDNFTRVGHDRGAEGGHVFQADATTLVYTFSEPIQGDNLHVFCDTCVDGGCTIEMVYIYTDTIRFSGGVMGYPHFF